MWSQINSKLTSWTDRLNDFYSSFWSDSRNDTFSSSVLLILLFLCLQLQNRGWRARSCRAWTTHSPRRTPAASPCTCAGSRHPGPAPGSPAGSSGPAVCSWRGCRCRRRTRPTPPAALVSAPALPFSADQKQSRWVGEGGARGEDGEQWWRRGGRNRPLPLFMINSALMKSQQSAAPWLDIWLLGNSDWLLNRAANSDLWPQMKPTLRCM